MAYLNNSLQANKTDKDGGYASPPYSSTKHTSVEINTMQSLIQGIFDGANIDTSTISINDSGALINNQEIVKAIQNFAGEKNFSATGTNSYSITIANTNLLPKTLSSQYKFSFIVPNTNTSTSTTLTINGLHTSKKMFKLDGVSSFAIGELVASNIVTCIYDSTLDSANGGYRCVMSQVNPDWNSSSGYSQILNKPNLIGNNFIINGNMSISQRGTSWSNPSAGSYTLDRWQASQLEPGCTKTISRVAIIPGELDGIIGASGGYWSRHQCTVAGTGTGTQNNDFTQRIEDATRLAGKTVTVSFLTKASAAKTLQIFITHNCGSGGSAEFGAAIQNISIATSVTKNSLTFTVPSLTGKTLGSGHHTYLCFRFPLNQTFDIYIKDVQIEIGSIATSFHIRPHALELSLCQRYYEKSYESETYPGTVADPGKMLWVNQNNQATFQMVFFKVEKRVTPYLTIYSTTGTLHKLWSTTPLADISSTIASSSSTSFVIAPAANQTATTSLACHFTADAEL